MYKLREEKIKMRKKYLEMRRLIDPETKREMDNKICALFTSLVSYRYAETLLMYYPKKSEVNTLPIIEAALKAGKRVALPLCNEEGSTMQYYYINSLDDLEEGLYHIPAPKKSCEIFSKESATRGVIAVIPGLSFDKKGYRLGYGKGYYDRYMEGLSACFVGLVYTDFISDGLPIGRYDISVDLLVTEKGVKIIENKG